MKILAVPYFPQIDPTSCGPAAFEMAYKKLRPSKLSKFSQKKVYGRLKEIDPGKPQYRVTTDDLVQLALHRSLSAGWGRVSPQPAELISQVQFFLEFQIPLIACQRYSDEDHQTGHFRVIIGIDEKEVVFHDPCPKIGGEARRKSIEEFIDLWRPTGQNVTGGVGFWIYGEVLTPPLAPDQPNRWNSLVFRKR